jgi:membrane protease YdiL (CAAX protease family)
VTDGDPGPPRLTAEEAATIGRRVRWGLGLTVAGIVGVGVGLELGALDTLALPTFLIFLPALALAQVPLLGKEELERMAVYLGSGITILLLGAMALLLGNWGVGLPALGLEVPEVGPFLSWTVGLVVAGLALAMLFRPLERRISGGPPPFMAQLLPRTSEERVTFAGLSLAAGWGEEMVYRGYVPALLVAVGMDLWVAFGVSSVSFGVLHAYQGPAGILRTTAMGLLLALPVAFTGSLYPAMAAHALYDLVAGLVLGPFLLGRGAGDAEDIDPHHDD